MVISRSATATSFASTAATADSGTRRQDAPARYISRKKLQALLERLFPNHKDKNFHIRIDNEIWSFDAPEEVSELE
ncbi:hypothetical protein AOQ84DRAFT_109286 [Glonium stellatum]|uniref:Uncharacterized protein n=1 Tax=Glonium stellatum TaxID=574774 RepID=A0A8E2JPH1_9PEZI|nr:hypothetical protein AOQ84DRAFT_109286 [Glonium stellatum]